MEVNERIIAGSQLRVSVADESDIGECRRVARRLGEEFSFDELTKGRVGIIATELATNILRHARHGEVLLQVLQDGNTAELELLAIDQGPGMQCTESCLRDGFSTGGTAGQGLGAVKRLSSTFDLFSRPGQGTVVLSRSARVHGSRDAARAPTEKGGGLELGAISVAIEGEIECGDLWRVAERGLNVAVMVADGLGHGPLAAAASNAAAAAFQALPFEGPATAMQRYHRALSGTRGAAAACALLSVAEGTLAYAGVGNIAGALVATERSQGLVSHNGTLGVQLLRTQQFDYAWPSNALLVMHSDGLSARWRLGDYPGLSLRHSAVIAGVLYRDFVRRRDDATVIVACHRN